MHLWDWCFRLQCFRTRRSRRVSRFVLISIACLTALFYYIVNFRIENGEPQWPQRDVEHYVPSCERERSNFVYIKMIKCASTTLAGVFRRFGLRRNLSFVLPPKDKIYVGWPYQIDETFYRPKKSKQFNILCEHAVYNRDTMSALMPADTVYITSLREPFAQFKSMVNYYNVLNISGVTQTSGQQNAFSVYLSDIASYDAVYTSSAAAKTRYCIPDGFQMSRNLMSYNLGFPTGFPGGETSDWTEDAAFIEKWLDEVSAKFKLVVMTEWFHESMILVRREMCWRLGDILFRSSNALSYGYKSHADARLLALYRDWSNVDYALYQRFNATFHARLARQDEQFWMEVDHYRRINEEVNAFCLGLKSFDSEVNSYKSGPAVFYVEESYWNTRFSVDLSFCEQLFEEDNLKTLHKLYEQQAPLNIVEPTPSKKTC